MDISVLLEPVAGNGYLAVSGAPLALRAEGATRAEAINNFKTLLQRRLSGGAELVHLPVESKQVDLRGIAGIHDPNDPRIEEWKQAMAQWREEKELDPNY